MAAATTETTHLEFYVLWDTPGNGQHWTVEGINVESCPTDQETIDVGREAIRRSYGQNPHFECVGPLYYIRHHDTEEG